MNYQDANIINEHKYNANLHICANTEQFESVYIGKVKANSIKELKEKSRIHARNWNKHLYGRIHVEDKNAEIELFINP